MIKQQSSSGSNFENCIFSSKVSADVSNLVRIIGQKNNNLYVRFFFHENYHLNVSYLHLVREPYEIHAKPWHWVYMGFNCILWLLGVYRPQNLLSFILTFKKGYSKKWNLSFSRFVEKDSSPPFFLEKKVSAPLFFFEKRSSPPCRWSQPRLPINLTRP